jgi:biopolymer transport protein ExbD
MRRLQCKSRRDPVISLINIVFLILIFFMVAGSLTTPPDPSIRFIQTQDIHCCVPPDAVSIDRTGTLRRDGTRIEARDILRPTNAESSSVRLLPDRDLPAIILLERVRELRAIGATNITIVTEDTTA